MRDDPNAAQAEFWNAEPGRRWVSLQPELDALHAEADDLLASACAAQPDERALDVGCGAGATTLALAAAVGPGGGVLGVDVSRPLLERARARVREAGLAQVELAEADAQVHPFAPAAFDLVASRFGVMFFADPAAAFANLAATLRPGGRIAFVAWAGLEANPWFSVPKRIAVARLGPVEPTSPDAPGPTAFRDAARVTRLLETAGFRDAAGETHAITLRHPEGVAAAARLATHVGPIARVLREKGGTPEDREAITAAVLGAFAPYAGPGGVAIPAAVTVFSARRS